MDLVLQSCFELGWAFQNQNHIHENQKDSCQTLDCKQK